MNCTIVSRRFARAERPTGALNIQSALTPIARVALGTPSAPCPALCHSVLAKRTSLTAMVALTAHSVTLTSVRSLCTARVHGHIVGCGLDSAEWHAYFCEVAQHEQSARAANVTLRCLSHRHGCCRCALTEQSNLTEVCMTLCAIKATVTFAASAL